MKNAQKTVIVLVAVLLLGGGYYAYTHQEPATTPAAGDSTEPIAATPSWFEMLYKNNHFQVAVPPGYSIYYAAKDLTLKSAANADTSDAAAFFIAQANLEGQKQAFAPWQIAIIVQKTDVTLEDLYNEARAYHGPIDGAGTYVPPQTAKIITRTASPTQALDIQFTETGYNNRIVELVGGGYQYTLVYDKTAKNADILEEIVSTFGLR